MTLHVALYLHVQLGHKEPLRIISSHMQHYELYARSMKTLGQEPIPAPRFLRVPFLAGWPGVELSPA